MKLIKKITLVFICFLPLISLSQETNEKSEETTKAKAKTKVDKTSYYTKRGEEDAKFEQQYKAEAEEGEKEFWKEQKDYEKDLKKRDKKAYKAYKKGKQDAYEEHYSHCDHHCHHSDYYYYHASYYYHGYHQNYSKTQLRLRTPRIRIVF